MCKWLFFVGPEAGVSKANCQQSCLVNVCLCEDNSYYPGVGEGREREKGERQRGRDRFGERRRENERGKIRERELT